MSGDTWLHARVARRGPANKDTCHCCHVVIMSLYLSDGLGENLLESDPTGSSGLESVGRHLDCQGAGLGC